LVTPLVKDGQLPPLQCAWLPPAESLKTLPWFSSSFQHETVPGRQPGAVVEVGVRVGVWVGVGVRVGVGVIVGAGVWVDVGGAVAVAVGVAVAVALAVGVKLGIHPGGVAVG
jgi:hypothetical protein